MTVEMALRLCQLGAEDEDLGVVLNIHDRTFCFIFVIRVFVCF